MPDLIERFRSLDQIDCPDLWKEAAGRTARQVPPARSPRERVIAVLVAFAVAAAAIAYAVAVLSRRTPARPADRPTPVPIQPHANGALYFLASEGEAGASVNAIQQDGSGNHVVFGRDTYHADMAWSSDGGRLAYAASSRDGGGFSINTSTADGSNETQLTSGPFDGWPSWSPDGSKIAFSSVTPDAYDKPLCGPGGDPLCPTDIYVMNADGSDRQRLTQDAAPEFEPQWSPDGTEIAFVRVTGDSAEIDVMNADGSDLRTIATGTGGNDRRFSWSPDGTSIAYVSTDAHAWGIHVVNADGTNDQTILRRDGVFSEGPVWSPDGNRIAFVSTMGAYPPGCGQDSDVCSDLFTMRSDGRDVQQLTNAQSGVSGIAWRPLPVPATSPSSSADIKAQLTKTISLGRPSSLSSIAYGDGSAWVALREGDSFNQYWIVRLDGETGQQIAKIPVDTVPEWEVGGGGLVFANGSVWVGGRTYDRATQREGGEVIQIDPRSNSVVHTISLPAPVDDLVLDESGLWILTSEGRTPTLERIDSVSGDVAVSISLDGDVGRSIVSADGAIFVLVRTGAPTLGDIVDQIDPSTQQVAERFTTKGSYNAIAETDGRVWLALGDGLLWMDPAAGQGRVVPESFNTGDVVAAGDGGVWVLGPSHGRAPSRYDIASGTLGPSVDVHHHAPISMAVAPGALWAANDDGTVSLITLSSGQPSG